MSMAPACLDCTRPEGIWGAWMWGSSWAVSGGGSLLCSSQAWAVLLRRRLYPGGHARDLIVPPATKEGSGVFGGACCVEVDGKSSGLVARTTGRRRTQAAENSRHQAAAYS